jgi:hypothetical protein
MTIAGQTMATRGKKWYDKNEAEVMQRLGLKPTKASGAGWIEKEDGQSDTIIAQLKSTDKSSITIQKQDIDTLRHNAITAHKTPVFVLQFLQSGELYVLCKLEDIQEISQEINEKSVDKEQARCYNTNIGEVCTKNKNIKEVQKSTSIDREKFFKEYNKQFKRRK